MAPYPRVALMLGACSAFELAAPAQEPAKPKVKVEFRWLEAKYTQGLTETWGVRFMCGPAGEMYPHKKPVLTAKDVARARIIPVDFSKSGLPKEMYMVAFDLTDEAKRALAAACGDDERKLLAVVVGGSSRATRVFEKAKAAEFIPQAGFFSSRGEAERVAEACR